MHLCPMPRSKCLVYVERVASGGKKNPRTGPVVTTSQSVEEEKILRYRVRDRIALRSERHTEDSYLGSASMCTGKKRNSLVDELLRKYRTYAQVHAREIQ